MSPPSSFASSQFLGLLVTPPPRSSAASLSPPSPSTLRSSGVSAAYAGAAERARAASLSPSSSSLYDTLGVSPGASGQEIKTSYRRLALECHPDVVATGRRGASADEFMRVHAAYATLSDPVKRAYYDRELTAAAAILVHHRRSEPAPSPSPSPLAYARCTSYPGYGRRTWETDQCW
ncbi:unnamed protein product [Musa acuminata subsp. malaccensis]|uniref:(wild Malaysian banana) hypothetical protein n=1 Tax=Musa acuminata subsp. malaccensis TaxID=214687 RepID=A0A804K6K2_MUSAM|nr:PREDICTED: chaperone protein dnaJ 11, chloroplastic-like [Musa acuminata subsp. malaccensis]XP_018685088.1 PREDICTED: chaperone protein dnaJ 11, chloroplastic-like [Musa acuminata subsp. malaccensis]XP_018685089.1 PREDICTED: chaperone protein dnaJ 11, chloroplastic-like [Musa acuminata subsp. malaccensis]XP_018685090.1 PREDICTED: chaperone protein dnaJ 11, chloroplastic-like [Musa acuminata subsp. malaccensis]XP_018685091.1 PREDICTED: chaperone protein dnaJ 11, chloroplastic-like [Musa acumi